MRPKAKWQPPPRWRPGTQLRQPAQAHDPAEAVRLRAEVNRLQRKLAVMERALAEVNQNPFPFSSPADYHRARRQFAAGYHRNGVTTLVQINDPHSQPRPGTVEAASGETFPASRRGYPLSDESRAFEETTITPAGNVFTRSWAVGEYRDGRMCVMGLDDSPTETDEDVIARVEAFKANPHTAAPTVDDAHRYAEIMAERQTAEFTTRMRWH